MIYNSDVLSARDQSALAHLAGTGDMEQLQQGVPPLVNLASHLPCR